MADPSSVAAGMELFPATGSLGDPSFAPDPATLVNQGLLSFDLAASATETATLADLSSVRSLAGRKIQAMVQAGHVLVGGSLAVTLGRRALTNSCLLSPWSSAGSRRNGRREPAARRHQGQVRDAGQRLPIRWRAGFHLAVLGVDDPGVRLPDQGEPHRTDRAARPRTSETIAPIPTATPTPVATSTGNARRVASRRRPRLRHRPRARTPTLTPTPTETPTEMRPRRQLRRRRRSLPPRHHRAPLRRRRRPLRPGRAQRPRHERR